MTQLIMLYLMASPLHFKKNMLNVILENWIDSEEISFT